MSDPVTNVEIEDVLSSIRRLVSDEGRAARPAPRVEPEDAEQASVNAHADEGARPALILTPSLRVAEEPQADEAEAADASDDGIDAAEYSAPLSVDDETDHAESSQSEFDQAEVDQAETDMDVSELDGSRLGDTDIGQAGLDDTDQGDMPVSDTVDVPSAEGHDWHDADGSEDTGNQKNASDLDNVPDAIILREEDLVQDVDNAENSDASESVEDAPETDGTDEAARSEEPQTNHTLFDETHSERSIEDKIAALEALIGPSNREFEAEPSETRDSIAKVTRLPWPDEAVELPKADPNLPDPDEASQEAEFGADPVSFEAAHAAAVQDVTDEIASAAASALPTGLDADGATLIDEDALRDMVADIVRQELQGPLGERITRNVRKLVRREIYRAMAANELD